ncbi:hypothetical protein [Streptomyces sp. PSKA30]|uniref:hypothetical protein n=1 Tax=Streptomyces sp. PSKA30 TaxID=2874597 RepID=UPI001CD18B72|nr:hypothetical protein [Streptomyces sp. PSKA30]MBZ9640743.1 hypothetical protein [Streptomyces sp. PSKA30]
MRELAMTKVAALCAVATLAAAMGTAAAAPAAAPSTAQSVAQRSASPVLVDCFWKSQVRPADFILACGDGNSRLTALRWSHWHAGSAVAVGLNAVNDCRPYCAAGRFHSYPVVVRLDDPQPWEKQPELQRYSRMTLTYPGDRPERVPRTVTYSLWD